MSRSTQNLYMTHVFTKTYHPGGGGGERVEGLNFRLENLARLNCIWPKKKKRINKNLHNCARNYFSISHAIIEKQKTS